MCVRAYAMKTNIIRFNKFSGRVSACKDVGKTYNSIKKKGLSRANGAARSTHIHTHTPTINKLLNVHITNIKAIYSTKQWK